jgi:hypothetical protein
MRPAHVRRLLGFALAVGSLALPPTALGAFGDQEIPVFRVEPSTTQAGGHPRVNLFFRFCNRGIDIVNVTEGSPAVVTTAVPHGIGSPQTRVRILGVEGVSGVNGDWLLNVSGSSVVSPTQFRLPGSTGTGTYVSNDEDQAQIGPNRGCIDTEERSQIRTKLKDFSLHLPPGFLGNPLAMDVCPAVEWQAAQGSCAAETVLGSSVSETIPQGSIARSPLLPVFTRLYNVETVGLEPARLGTDRFGSTPPGPFPIIVSVRTAGDFGLDSGLVNIPRNLGGPEATIMEIKTTLCSHVPCDPNTFAHDPATAKPFFVNPTRCDADKKSVLEARSWFTSVWGSSADDPNLDGNRYDRASFRPTGCDLVPFDAFMTLVSETTRAASPSGQTFAIRYPRMASCPALPAAPDCTYENEEIWQSHLRHADVTLPDGLFLSPGGGVGLQGCSAAQFGVDLATNRPNNEPVQCPEGSQIGDVTVKSPVLPTPLDGKAFFGPATAPGRPTPASPWKLFLLIEGHGLRIKLIGDVSVEESGRISNTFRNQPEVPFSEFQLRLRGGDHAVLMNPTGCDPRTGNVVLTGWADTPAMDGAPAIDKKQRTHPQFSIAPTDCPASRPFEPRVDEATGTPDQAGANSVSRIVLSKPDGNQDLKSLRLALPAGAVGSLAAIPECPLAHARAGTCPDESRIGNIKTTVGSGNGLLTVPGYLYLAQPSQPGDAATIAIKVPSKVGPIDLGNVVLLNRVVLRPSDTGVDVLSSDIPRMFEGVPLPLRRIEITVDREGFFLNPTGCDPRALIATFDSYEGAQMTTGVTLSATGCERLAFGPRLRLTAGGPGATDQFDHPPLRAIVTQRPREGNIAQARVILPLILRPNVPFFNKPGALCNDAQAAARACPPKSNVGVARVSTPVLPFELSGPVHIVQEAGNILPKLYVFLRGRGLEVVLRARNSFLGGRRTINTFEGLPDVPQSYFEMRLNGGRDGILNNFEDLCTATRSDRVFDARFFGHSGKVVDSRPLLQIRGCEESDVRAARLRSRSVRVSRRGVAELKVRCKRTKRCRGRLVLRGPGVTAAERFRIPGRKARDVAMKLTRGELRRLRKARRLTTRATLRIGTANTAQAKVTLIAPRRR